VLAGSLAVGVALPAFAQGTQQLEEVVVTGTRITKPDLVSNSPIATVSAAALEQLNTSTLETQLRQLPQFLPGDTEYLNNGNAGAATINLRGLGDVRTLVLLDGKRLPPFGTSGAVDINLIPPAIIERIDIVTGGASAVYGSDAVTGVVNFITKKNFEGVQVDLSKSEYGEGDGDITNAALTFGTTFADDRGSAVVSVGYTERKAVLLGDRDYSNFNLFAADGYRYAGNWYEYSSDIFGADRRLGSSNAGATRAGIRVGANGAFANRYFTPDGQLLSNAALQQTPYGPNNTFNYNPYNYFQVPAERWNAFASLNYKLNDAAEVYGRVFAVSTSVPTQLASSAYFGGSTAGFQTNLDNPFLSEAQRQVLITAYNNQAARGENPVYDPNAAPGTQLVTVNGIRRRMLELGPREGVAETDTIQLTSGVRGDIGDSGWDYDVSAQYGRVASFQGIKNDVNTARARDALFAIQTPDGIRCIAAAPCVPINLFTGNGAVDPSTGQPMTGAMSQEALDYVRANYFSNSVNEAKNASVNVSGEVAAVKLPSAETPLALAFGIDWNEWNTRFDPDDLTKFGGAMGQGGTSPPLSGRLDSTEFYGEAYLPLISGKPGIDMLALETGLRFSDTNLSGSFETWKAGLEYSPAPGYRFRAMAQRAVRAPNIGEQFEPLSFGLTEVRGDPCAGAAPLSDPALAQKCVAQGAPPGQLGSIQSPAAQQAASIGGGAIALGVQLEPEEADTFTVGLQMSPGWLPGFSASIDYYKIKIDGGIGVYPAQEILDNCFQRDIASFCGLIFRNAVGELEGDGFGIRQETTNLSVLKAEGIDYSFSYTFDVNAFDVTLGLIGTHTLDNSFRSTPLAPVTKCAGFYGDTCGSPTPEDVATLSVSVGWRAFTGTLFMRHLSSVDVQARLDDPDQTGRSIYLIESIDSYQYFDLSLQYNWNDRIKVTLAAQNITDEDPTIVGNIPGGNTVSNTYPDIYDPLGQRYSLGVSVKF
jgi:outer membrane receptor protein involved in Fe transport